MKITIDKFLETQAKICERHSVNCNCEGCPFDQHVVGEDFEQWGCIWDGLEHKKLRDMCKKIILDEMKKAVG